jgi:hypothetical protein
MPPLGVQRRDEAAAEKLRAFIEALPREGASSDSGSSP